MDCDDCKDKLSAYIDNELSPEESFSLEEHIQKCSSCAHEMETLRQINVLMGGLPEQTPSPAFLQRTVCKAAAVRRRSSWKNRFLNNPVFSFIRNAVAFVFIPGAYNAYDEKSLSSRGYLRTFDDSPPGSFVDVYLTVIQGGGN
jgi:anti-sigma factor RsiW